MPRPQFTLRALLVAITLAVALPLVIVLLAYLSHGTVVVQLGAHKEDVAVRLDGSIIEIDRIDEPRSLLIGNHEVVIEGKDFTSSFTMTVYPGENEPIAIFINQRNLFPVSVRQAQ